MLSLCVMHMHVCVRQDTSDRLDSDFGRSLEFCILLSPFLILSPSFSFSSFSHESYRICKWPQEFEKMVCCSPPLVYLFPSLGSPCLHWPYILFNNHPLIPGVTLAQIVSPRATLKYIFSLLWKRMRPIIKSLFYNDLQTREKGCCYLKNLPNQKKECFYL